MNIIEVLLTQEKLVCPDTIALIRNHNDALDYGRKKSREQQHVVRVKCAAGDTMYFCGGEEVVWTGRFVE